MPWAVCGREAPLQEVICMRSGSARLSGRTALVCRRDGDRHATQRDELIDEKRHRPIAEAWWTSHDLRFDRGIADRAPDVIASTGLAKAVAAHACLRRTKRRRALAPDRGRRRDQSGAGDRPPG